AALGAIVVNYAKTYFTSGLLAPYWLFMLGGLFIGVTLLLPRGIVGSMHHWTALRRARASAAAEEGVTVSFDGFRALNNLSFAIEPGEMRAIIGPNGAGKTTMMDVVTGKTRPD